MTIQFKKAIKFDAKGRVALIGPAGSGKSFTMLTLARLLAGPEGKIAAVDTEHGSLSKYADAFDFDVIEMESFSPDNFNSALTAAEQAGYAVFCCDSLSHFWMGKDGALEFVDEKAKKYKDNMGGWKEFRPHERAMVDRMIASPLHVICTMRTKTDYQEVEKNGKKQRVKVGLAPVQRDGMEYEFDLVGYMDDENTLIVDKTRCPIYSGRAITKPSAKELTPFKEWLKGAERVQVPQAPPAEAAAQPTQARETAPRSEQPKSPAPPQQPRQNRSASPITQPQQSRFFAIANKSGATTEQIKAVLKICGYEHSKDIRMGDYEALCGWFESGEWAEKLGDQTLITKADVRNYSPVAEQDIP